MTQRAEMTVLDSTGTKEITNLVFDDGLAGTASTAVWVKVSNAGTVNTTATRLYCCRADHLVVDRVGEDAEDARTLGKEVIDETWMEARLSALDAWTPLDKDTAYLALGAIIVGASVDVQLRINPASTATTLGTTLFNLILRSTTA
jgi:hypothetical protein